MCDCSVQPQPEKKGTKLCTEAEKPPHASVIHPSICMLRKLSLPMNAADALQKKKKKKNIQIYDWFAQFDFICV